MHLSNIFVHLNVPWKENNNSSAKERDKGIERLVEQWEMTQGNCKYYKTHIHNSFKFLLIFIKPELDISY